MCYVFVAFEPYFSFSASCEQAILLASCRASGLVEHFYIGLARGMSLRFGEKYLFSFISCVLSPLASNASISSYHFSYRLQGLHFLILFSLRPNLAWGLALFLSSWFGVGGNTLASFHFISSLRVLWREKCRFFFQTHLREGYLLFGRWANSLKAQIALMMRKCNLMFV